MILPSITDYVRTLGNPHGVFRTLGEVSVERDIYRDIGLRAGNSAAVFTYMARGGRRFLKCYVRPNRRLREIYGYIERFRPELLSDVRLLTDELFVHTLSGGEGWTDIVEGAWTEGETLDVVITSAAKNGDIERIRVLADGFDDLCRELLSQEWAHGDLKPENIVVRPDGGMTLIDCDAMWIPQFAGERAVELGTPAYRHPGRDTSHFDKRIDDYPMLLISASLRALVIEPSLFARYNTTDNLIFSPVELIEGCSLALDEVSELFSCSGMARGLRMLEACCSRFPDVENAGRFFMNGSYFTTPSDLCPFVENGAWGFTDAAGTVCIEPFWDEVLEFRGETTAVRLGKWWHAIDHSGGFLETGMTRDMVKEYRHR